jgi:hypothetical protein
MLTYNDVLSLSDLTEDEIEAIAEHEHIPEICAAEFGYYLVHSERGVPLLRRIIMDDIAAARAAGDERKVLKLRMVLTHFIRSHPENAEEAPAETG